MWAALTSVYPLAIMVIGGFLFGAVNQFEPNLPLAIVLKIAVITVGAVAIANNVLPGGLLAVLVFHSEFFY